MAGGSSVANWALVVGIDEYSSQGARLQGAVRDALKMRDWLLDTRGGGVPRENLVLALAPRPDDPPGVEYVEATKDKLMLAINDLITMSGGKGERLYVFYAGHGLTARVANRDENALVTTDFNAVNTDNSVALRSLWEFFETTQFADQFFFVDACRNMPWDREREFEIGRWTLPRSRDPGVAPVQQFILYATSPGLKATEKDDFGDERGAFTDALLLGLHGEETAKAWSWNRECYEVRWERLVDFVKSRVEREKHAVGEGAAGALLQIPQDAGSRGVAGRDRDPVVVSFPTQQFEKLGLSVELEPDSVYETARIRVLDGVGDTVAEVEAKTGGRPVTFELAPKTYALRAVAEEFEEGRTKQPVELYERERSPVRIELRPRRAPPGEVEGDGSAEDRSESFGATPSPSAAVAEDGRVTAESVDPLALVEVCDNTGAVAAAEPGRVDVQLPPGFYRVRLVTPEAVGTDVPIALAPAEQEPLVRPPAPAPADEVARLVEAVGGRVEDDGAVVLSSELPPLVAPQRTTILALSGAAAARGDSLGRWLDLQLPAEEHHGATHIVLLLDAGSAAAPSLEQVAVRLWAAGERIPDGSQSPRPVGDGVGALVLQTADLGAHWLSLEPPDQPPLVFALTLLPRRPPLVVAHVDPDRMRIFQYLLRRPGAAVDLEATRVAEYAQRLLLAGRLAAAEPLARRLAAGASDDPLAGCLGGYALLRLGNAVAEVTGVADAVVATAPELADGFILRGEASAAAGDAERSRQAFADAIATGVPVFAEGLTRLVEGLRATNFGHPRAAIVRHLFQRHLRGSMWSVFVPRPRGGSWTLEPGRLLITGADTGFEA